MRSFLKHTVWIMVFVAGLALLLIVASWILVPKNNAQDAGMRDPTANGILSEPDDTIDVLFLGDSESYCSVIPLKIWEQYGITSYCCGTSSQTLCYSQEFLYKTFKNQLPKIVVLETNAIFRDFSFSDLLLHKADAIFPVITYHNRWKSLEIRDFDFAVNYTYIENGKGYQFATTISAANTNNYMKETNARAPISQLNRSYVESMKTFCEENGAKLVLLSTPSTINWNTARHNSINDMAEELNLDYIDMNLMRDEIPINWDTDTRDKGDHLNHFGAVKVTAYLGKYLSGTGLAENHKYDPEYKGWNDQLEFFNKTISASIPK